MTTTKRWTRRLMSTVRIDPAAEPAASTLETFFAGVRWTEDQHPGGRTTLRPPSM